MKPLPNSLFVRICVFVCLLFLCVPLHAQKPSPDDLLVLNNINVVDVRTGAILPEQTVVLNKNRIDSVGPTKTSKTPRNAPSVNCRGLYLIPGLWDMHVNLFFGD